MSEYPSSDATREPCASQQLTATRSESPDSCLSEAACNVCMHSMRSRSADSDAAMLRASLLLLLCGTNALQLPARTPPLDSTATNRRSLLSSAALVAAGCGMGATLARPTPPWVRPVGVLHKSTFAVRDPGESVRFCIKYLGASEITVPDGTLRSHGIRWVRLAGGSPTAPASELHFVPWSFGSGSTLRGGVDLNGDGVVSGDELVPMDAQLMASAVEAAAGNLTQWSAVMNTHVGWAVADLTPIVLALQSDGVPFFGPTQRADGVFQLYLPLPYEHIVEVDSTVYDAARTGVAPRDWRTR